MGCMLIACWNIGLVHCVGVIALSLSVRPADISAELIASVAH